MQKQLTKFGRIWPNDKNQYWKQKKKLLDLENAQ